MIWNWVIDHIPLWGWIVIVVAVGGVVMAYAYPVLLPIWRMLPGPVKALLITIVVGVVAFLGGRNKGRLNAEEEERRRNAEALQKRVEVDREVGKLSGDEAQKRLRDRWGAGDT